MLLFGITIEVENLLLPEPELRIQPNPTPGSLLSLVLHVSVSDGEFPQQTAPVHSDGLTVIIETDVGSEQRMG